MWFTTIKRKKKLQEDIIIAVVANVVLCWNKFLNKKVSFKDDDIENFYLFKLMLQKTFLEKIK